jgi:hypothetical protein
MRKLYPVQENRGPTCCPRLEVLEKPSRYINRQSMLGHTDSSGTALGLVVLGFVFILYLTNFSLASIFDALLVQLP